VNKRLSRSKSRAGDGQREMGKGGLVGGGYRGVGEKTQEYTTHNIANPAGTHFLHQTSLQQS